MYMIKEVFVYKKKNLKERDLKKADNKNNNR